MTDFRALCAELLAALENEGYAHWVHTPDEDELCLRARAALAQPEPEGPTDEELLRVAASAIEPYQSCGIALNEYEAETGTAVEVYSSELIAFARAVLARWGRPTPLPVECPACEGQPAPSNTPCAVCGKEGTTPQPANGEVAELVADLLECADSCTLASKPYWAAPMRRAAELLERLSPPQPIPVSERLPGPEDCDAEGRCWWLTLDWEGPALWDQSSTPTHWLPAHALPLPS